MNIYIAFTVVCSFFYAVGAILCKYGMRDFNSETHPNILQLTWFLIRNKIWFLGVFITLFSNISVLQIQSILDLSVVHSILNSSYIFTLCLGYIFLGEQLSRRQWEGTLTVIFGTTLILFVGEPVTGAMTKIDNLFLLSLLSIAIIVGLLVVARINNAINYEIVYAISAGIAFGNSQVYVKASTNLIADQSGYFSVLSLHSINEFVHVWPSLALFFFAVIGFVCMQISFSHGKVSICVALLAVISRAISTSSGYYIFSEQFSFLKVAGILTILTGVFIITFSSVKKQHLAVSPA